MMGVTPDQAVGTLAALGVAGVGANCGRGPDELEPVVEQLAAVRPEGVLLVAQSNAGLPQLVGDRFVYDADPGRMATPAARLAGIGVELVGACCGSTPAHLAAMAAELTALRTPDG